MALKPYSWTLCPIFGCFIRLQFYGKGQKSAAEIGAGNQCDFFPAPLKKFAKIAISAHSGHGLLAGDRASKFLFLMVFSGQHIDGEERLARQALAQKLTMASVPVMVHTQTAAPKTLDRRSLETRHESKSDHLHGLHASLSLPRCLKRAMCKYWHGRTDGKKD